MAKTVTGVDVGSRTAIALKKCVVAIVVVRAVPRPRSSYGRTTNAPRSLERTDMSRRRRGLSPPGSTSWSNASSANGAFPTFTR